MPSAGASSSFTGHPIAGNDSEGSSTWGRDKKSERNPKKGLLKVITTLCVGGGALASTTYLWPLRLLADGILMLSIVLVLAGPRQTRVREELAASLVLRAAGWR